jgi:hypothetical protein
VVVEAVEEEAEEMVRARVLEVVVTARAQLVT